MFRRKATEVTKLVSTLLAPDLETGQKLQCLKESGAAAKAAVPALIKTLADKQLDVGVRADAAWALMWIGVDAQSAIPVLENVLFNEPDGPSGYCVRALREMGRPAVPILLKALKHPDVEVRKEVAQDLQYVKPQPAEAIPALIEALRDADVRDKARTSLESFGEAAIPVLHHALSDADVHVRVNVASVLLKIDKSNQAATNVAIACLKDPAPEVRHQAVSGLYDDAGAHQELTLDDYLILLNDEDWFVRSFALFALRNIGPPMTQDAMAALLEALDDPYNRDTAMQALGDLGPAASCAVPKLMTFLPGESEDAVQALGNIGPPAKDALPVLRELAAKYQPDEAPEWLEMLAEAIEQIEGKRPRQVRQPLSSASIPELIEALQDGNAVRTIAASDALVRHGEEAVPALVKLLSSPDVNIRATVLAALREMGSRAQAAIPALIKGLGDQETYSSGTPMHKLYGLALARIGPTALPAVRKALESKNQTVRIAAAEVFRNIDPEAAQQAGIE
jgi:HEAT repeat protein